MTWIFAAVCLTLIPDAPAGAGSLEISVNQGRVVVQAHAVPLGQVVEALSQGTGLHVVLDAQRAEQPVTLRLEVEGIQEAIARLLREAGGGNYAIYSSDSQGKVETFAFRGGGGAQTTSPAMPPAPPASSAPPAYGAGNGSTLYAAPGPRYPDEKPAAMSLPYPPSPGSASAFTPAPIGRLPAPVADEDHGVGSPTTTGRGKLADLEYQRRLEVTRSRLEPGAEPIEDQE